jgi:hypothetical protein
LKEDFFNNYHVKIKTSSITISENLRGAALSLLSSTFCWPRRLAGDKKWWNSELWDLFTYKKQSVYCLTTFFVKNFSHIIFCGIFLPINLKKYLN